jgi:hypothetical protein
MLKKIFWVVFIIFGMSGCSTAGSGVQKGAGSPPVLENAFLSPEVNFKDVIKLYFRASDPDGDMEWVLTSIGAKMDVKGRPIYPGATRLRGESQKSISGYLYWDSSRAVAAMEGETVKGTIAIWVEDAAGNSSEKKYLPVTILQKGAKIQSPPEGEYSEKELGQILIDTRDLMHPRGGIDRR